MPHLVISRVHGHTSYAIDYCENPRGSEGRLAKELLRIPLTDAEAALGLAELRRLNPWDAPETAQPATPAAPGTQAAAGVALAPTQTATPPGGLPAALAAAVAPRTREPVEFLEGLPETGRSWVRELFEGPEPDDGLAVLVFGEGDGWDPTGETWAQQPTD